MARIKITAARLHKSKFINSVIDRGGRGLTEKGKARLEEPRILQAGYGPLQELEKRLAELDAKNL